MPENSDCFKWSESLCDDLYKIIVKIRRFQIIGIRVRWFLIKGCWLRRILLFKTVYIAKQCGYWMVQNKTCSNCTALKAAGLLSCLWMKIVSLEMNWTKCNIWERFGLRSLGAVISLLRWTMLLCEEWVCQLHGLLWLVLQWQLVLKRSTTKRVRCTCVLLWRSERHSSCDT